MTSEGQQPPEVKQVVITTGTIWRAVAIVLATVLALWALNQMRSLVMMLAISVFFALALTPGVNYLHARRGWRRGAAVGVIYVVGAVAVVVMVVLIVPAIAKVGGQISAGGTEWMTSLDTWVSSKFGFHIVDKQAYKDGAVTVGEFLKQWASKLLPAAGKVVSTGAGLVFEVATVGLFTFYLTADFPRLQKAFLSWFKPGQQERLGWTVDQSIKQVGGYLYSRLLLTVINSLGFLAVMVAVGVPTGLAIPLAVVGGFISEFIPSVGTYIGGAIPVVLTLALAGLVPALIVIAYIVIYQQIENYWLSPRIGAKTMELNGGLAFGAAIAGGALFGPMGAFMALPVAALIVAVLHNYRHAYPVFYRSQYVDAADEAAANGSGGTSRQVESGLPGVWEGRSAVQSRKVVDWEERRAELAEAVWRTIANRGLENTSIRNIAEESDWTRGVLQRYFRDKDELMLFAYELASDHAVSVNVRAIGDATGLEALRRRLLIYARPDAEQRQVTEVLSAFPVHARTQPELVEAINDRYREWVRVTQAIFRDLEAQGVLREGLDVEHAAVEYLAFATGLARLDYLDNQMFQTIDPEKVVDGYLSRIGAPAELERLGIRA